MNKERERFVKLIGLVLEYVQSEGALAVEHKYGAMPMLYDIKGYPTYADLKRPDNPAPHFGVEIEFVQRPVGFGGVRFTSASMQAITWYLLTKNGWLGDVSFQEDRSVVDGGELITRPMTKDELRKLFVMFNEDYVEEFFDTSSNEAGLHITVDPFKYKKHAYRFYDAFNTEEVIEVAQPVLGRYPNTYCRLDAAVMTSYRFNRYKGNKDHKYGAVRIRENGAMEVRLFQSSLDPDHLMMCVELVDKVRLWAMTDMLVDDLIVDIETWLEGYSYE